MGEMLNSMVGLLCLVYPVALMEKGCVSEKELHAAHTYILLNYEEIEEYVRLYDDELKVKHPGITDKDIQINRDKEFAFWLKDKALTVGSSILANVLSLAMGPDKDQVSRNGYKVNGYDFHTKAYGLGKKTMNSRVFVQEECYNELNHAFYGELEEIIELSYKGTYGGHISLFKCRWFDSEKRKRVDRHGIVEIDLHRSTYFNEPFVLPTQAVQVYYTLSPGRKRDRPPVDWQVVIHTPARKREVVDAEIYQEQMLHRQTKIDVDDNEIIELDSADDPEEIDPNLILVSDNEEDEEMASEAPAPKKRGRVGGPIISRRPLLTWTRGLLSISVLVPIALIL